MTLVVKFTFAYVYWGRSINNIPYLIDLDHQEYIQKEPLQGMFKKYLNILKSGCYTVKFY